MSIAALSIAGSIQDAVASQRAIEPLPQSSAQHLVVDTRNRPTIDRTAALVKDEFEVSESTDASVNSEETETEGLSVYA